MVKWFKKAVRKKPPYSLGGWSKTQAKDIRRRHALNSRPKGWTLNHKRLSAARALMAIANVTKDKQTRIVAMRDARYFFKLAKKK